MLASSLPNGTVNNGPFPVERNHAIANVVSIPCRHHTHSENDAFLLPLCLQTTYNYTGNYWGTARHQWDKMWWVIRATRTISIVLWVRWTTSPFSMVVQSLTVLVFHNPNRGSLLRAPHRCLHSSYPVTLPSTCGSILPQTQLPPHAFGQQWQVFEIAIGLLPRLWQHHSQFGFPG